MALSLIFSVSGGIVPWLRRRITRAIACRCAIGAEMEQIPVAITLAPDGPVIVPRDRWERHYGTAYEYAFRPDMTLALRRAMLRADERYGDAEPFGAFIRWTASLFHDLTPRLILDLDPERAAVEEWLGLQKASPSDLLRLCRLGRSFELIQARPLKCPTNGDAR